MMKVNIKIKYDKHLRRCFSSPKMCFTDRNVLPFVSFYSVLLGTKIFPFLCSEL
jgi:hypothetical protein